ncbi:hypothetical protein MMC29_008427, partial [Sticta canariensis]|nr:hypothetical protein [Sticta canariensis]
MPTTSAVSSSSKTKSFSKPYLSPPDKKKFKSAQLIANSEDESQDSEGSSTGTESGTDSEGSSTDTESGTDSANRDGGGQGNKELPLPKEKQATTQKPVPQYELPSGFGPATITLASSELTELVSSHSLRTKQFWHIKAPSSVPINSIREVSMQSIQSGSAVLTHEGADYGLIAEVQDQSAKKVLLLPSANANEYKSAEVGIFKTINLQRLIPDRRYGNNVRSKFEKPLRQQPEGLKMRYRPFGDTEDTFERSGFESSLTRSMQAPEFRNPISIETSSPSKKNKNHEENNAGMGGDTVSVIKKRERKRHAKSLADNESSRTELQRDYTGSPRVSKKRKSPPESERGDAERPIKKNKSQLSLESVPDARGSPSSSNAVHPEASGAPKGSKVQKKMVNTERDRIDPSKASQNHKVPSESTVVAKINLLDEKPEAMRKSTKREPSAEPASTNRYPEDTNMLDPPISIPIKRTNEEISHHGEHPNAEPDVTSVRKETKRDDEIIAEPTKTKQKSKKEKRRRERSDGLENTPAGETTRSVTDAAEEAKPTKPAAETLTEKPTTTTKPANTMTAEALKPRRKEKKERRRHKDTEETTTEQPVANNHPL